MSDDLTRSVAEALGCDATMDDEGDYYCSEHGDYLHHTGQCLEAERIADALAPLFEARVREARAKAWDEGHAIGAHDQVNLALFNIKPTPNPYRKENG